MADVEQLAVGHGFKGAAVAFGAQQVAGDQARAGLADLRDLFAGAHVAQGLDVEAAVGAAGAQDGQVGNGILTHAGLAQ